LLEKFRTSARTAFLFQTQCNSREFMRFLLAELGYGSDDQDFVRMHEEFNKRLLQEARAGNRFIVVIDEAQNLDPAVLETVRLLSDFETPRAKLMQIVLAGQPELADKLANPRMAQLRQRVSLVSGLQPLSFEETNKYIYHRLRVAGHRGEQIFSPAALARITEFAAGIPRNINSLCFNSMSLGCALQQKVMDAAIVEEVITDLDITRHTTKTVRGPSDFGPATAQVFDSSPANVFSPVITQRFNGNSHGTRLSPSEARSYMEQIVTQLQKSSQLVTEALSDRPKSSGTRNLE
jgi:general secretion pathway protein A